MHARSCVVDFESGIHTAVRSKWPDIELIGCRFHLRQAWYRQIQRLGLQSAYQKIKGTNGETIISAEGRWLRYVFGLAYLNPAEVHDAFISDLLTIRPQSPNFAKYTEYLLSNYIHDDAKYPPTLWACETADLERTTNACESFHSRLNESLYKSHPDVFSFTHKLIEFQTETYVTIQSLDTMKEYVRTEENTHREPYQ